jgi:SAM-dependent methyltransferase
MKPHLETARLFWKELLKPDDTVIDATCGNGKDTAYLAELVLQGKVISLDIQEAALSQARQIASHPHVDFRLQSHADLPLLEGVKLVVYNLGYLPGGDKSITTMTSSTVASLGKATGLIIPGGAVSITCYPGHPEGALEAKAVAEWTYQLNSSQWDVVHHQWRPGSPTLFLIQKK